MTRFVPIRISSQQHRIFFRLLYFFSAVLLLSQTFALAAPSYDPYAPVASEVEEKRLELTEKREFIRPVADILALPFEVVKLGIDPVLYQLEKRHVAKKIYWVYNKLKDRGIGPFIIQKGYGEELGLNLESVELAGLKKELPGVSWHNKIKWIPLRNLFGVYTGPEIERVWDTPLSLRSDFMYERRSEEDFWGIGPDSGLGQGSNYDQEKTAFNFGADYDFNYIALASLMFGYQHVNIAEGFDSNETHGGGKNNIKAAFPTLPGINGSDEINFTWALESDHRDNKDRPTRGHYEKIGFGYHYGVRGSDTRYFKYLTDLSYFLPILSDRRIFAVRFYGEHNSELDSDEVPFFNKARLGGHVSDPEGGLPLRSFERNRFYDDSVVVLNIEYRYNIWHYRDLKMDAVIFFDDGMVFDQFAEMQWRDLQESYGGGFRIFVRDKNIATLEAAHGNEGTEFYARTGTVF